MKADRTAIRYAIPLTWRVDDPKEVADAIHAAEDMGFEGGMLVTVPIPAEWSMDADYINKAIDEALVDADRQGIVGKDTTPFLLKKIKEITGGSSLASNIQLVFNNVKTAARIAAKL